MRDTAVTVGDARLLAFEFGERDVRIRHTAGGCQWMLAGYADRQKLVA